MSVAEKQQLRLVHSILEMLLLRALDQPLMAGPLSPTFS